ncbi:hypothetical protein [Enterovibrio sp. 27052020O]|uniref:capsular polysaccharide export protein, LipB/KpsS family n=1 Tax=Enterovibrio sp. 27052020O TaxID=3241166 RepID=UPI00388E8EB1
MSITFITPFDCKDKESYLYERAKYFLYNCYISDKVTRIFVDFSSRKDIAEELREIAVSRGIEFITLGRYGEQFSIGLCRNAGVQAAKTRYISFQDVDLYAPDFIYNKIEERISKYEFFNEFEMIPCLYLTEEYSNNYLSLDECGKDEITRLAYLESDKSKIQMYAPASSCQIVERELYLMSGGINDEFYGHGYEDFELHMRLCDLSKKFYRTHSATSHEYPYDSIDYRGYRPYFSMFGRPLMSEGIYFVHLWHESHVGTNYQKRNKSNKIIFEKLLNDHAKGNDRSFILSDNRKENKILVLSSPNSVNAKSLKQLFVTIGNCVFRSEELFDNFDSLKVFIKRENIDRVFFFNPYGKEHRLSLYRSCKENGVPFYVFDRGALNDSWFIDPNGFNGDSSTYDRENWDFELDESKVSFVERYIEQTFVSDETLEENGERVGANFFRRRFSPDGRKILFVPFQRPNDSVIKYFSGSVDGVDDFSKKLRVIADKLSDQWVVVAKKHPLETNFNLPENVVELPEKTHVYDCIQGSDAVLLINSGVGLLSVMANKPVYHFGDTYYAHDTITCRVNDEFDAVDKILNGFQPRYEDVLKFVHYLISKVYSFAKTEYKLVSEGEANRNVSIFSRFYKVNIQNGLSRSFKWRENPYPVNSRYYDFYRSYFSKDKPVHKQKMKEHVKVNDSLAISENNKPAPKLKKYGFRHKMKKVVKDPVGVVKRKVKVLF